MRIVETARYGRALLLDGRMQSAQRDEALYHETLVHPALLHAATPPRRVAILGGGEGATLREVLRHRSVERATMVDIDRVVVEASAKHLPEWNAGAFRDPRAEVVIGDAREWVERGGEPLDAVIGDLTDPDEEGPAAALYAPAFFRRLLERLVPGGVGVFQGGPATPPESLRGFAAIVSTLRDLFPLVVPYALHIPSFAAMWGFVFFAREPLPPLDGSAIDARIAERLSSPPRAFDWTTWEHALSLPLRLREGFGA